nr:MAG TPA: hypothetical protein [Caudoviricetes sp.]DAS04498.1 MAG TPA: hypothetical protein [Caudoviricetes sp.]
MIGAMRSSPVICGQTRPVFSSQNGCKMLQ